MEPELYIERVRSMRSAGLRVKQVATPDTKDLTDKIAEKLHNADIGWKVQILTGRDETGRMVPQSMEDVNSRYELEFDPAKYI